MKDQIKNQKGGGMMSFMENIEEVENQEEVDLSCGNDNGSKVPFCCVQVIPGNLKVDKCKLKKENLELTFTPKLRYCMDEEVITCDVNGVECEIEAEVLRLVGCIQYALSTKKRDPISGKCNAEAVAACCSSIVCVDNIVACNINVPGTLECPGEIDLCNINVKINDAVVKKCPDIDHPDKKIIKFTGKFILPTL